MGKVQMLKVKGGDVYFIYLPSSIVRELSLRKGDEVEIKLDTTTGDQTGEKIIVIKKVKK